MYAQIGGCAFAEIMNEADHPVTPSLGSTSPTFMPALRRSFVMSGQPAPITASPDLNRPSKSEASTQYLRTSGACAFSFALTLSSVAWSIAYGSWAPSNWSATSAIWIGLSGTVILPLYFGSYRSAPEVGGVLILSLL